MKRWFVAILTFVALLGLWELCSRLGLLNSQIFPSPVQSINALANLFNKGVLLSDVLASAARYIPGYVIGGVLGVFVGVLTGLSKTAEYSASPLFHYLRSIPPVALVPFSLMLFGIGDLGKIVLVAWACFFPVWLSVQAGIKQVPIEYLRTAEIFEIKGMRQALNVWIPYSLPYIFNGLRLSISTGVFALTAAEMLAASSGIGFRIINSHQLFHMDAMIGMILLLGAISMFMDFGVTILGRFVMPWEHKND